MWFKSGKLGGLFVVRHPVGKIKIRETDILELVIMSSSSCKSLSMDRESTPYFFFISFNLICWHPPVRAASVAAVNNQGACVLLPLVPPPLTVSRRKMSEACESTEMLTVEINAKLQQWTFMQLSMGNIFRRGWYLSSQQQLFPYPFFYQKATEKYRRRHYADHDSSDSIGTLYSI